MCTSQLMASNRQPMPPARRGGSALGGSELLLQVKHRPFYMRVGQRRRKGRPKGLSGPKRASAYAGKASAIRAITQLLARPCQHRIATTLNLVYSQSPPY